MHLNWQVWVQLVELSEEGRTLIGVVGSDMNNFKMMSPTRCNQVSQIVLKMREWFLYLIRLEINILYIYNQESYFLLLRKSEKFRTLLVKSGFNVFACTSDTVRVHSSRNSFIWRDWLDKCDKFFYSRFREWVTRIIIKLILKKWGRRSVWAASLQRGSRCETCSIIKFFETLRRVAGIWLSPASMMIVTHRTILRVIKCIGM